MLQKSTPNSANFAKLSFVEFWVGLAGSGGLVMGAGLVWGSMLDRNIDMARL